MQNMTKKKVMLAVGGSGGHLLPAQQLGALLEGKVDVLLAGHGLSKNSFVTKEARICDIDAGAWGKGKYFQFLYRSCKGVIQALFLLKKFSPDVVVGFGSYHTFPVLAAAFLLRKKIILFEANCILGKVNRLFLPAAHTLATQFVQKTEISKAALVPALPWVQWEKKTPSKKEASLYFGLDSKKTTILVFGGSQGASFLNERLPRVMAYFKDVQVIHFTGKGGHAVYGNPSCVKEFEPRMDFAYAAADVVVCRSGAGTVAELIYYRKPALLIPFPFAMENHQLENGRFLAHKVQGALLLEQREATLEKIEEKLKNLLQEIPEKQSALERLHIEKRTNFADLILGTLNSQEV